MSGLIGLVITRGSGHSVKRQVPVQITTQDIPRKWCLPLMRMGFASGLKASYTLAALMASPPGLLHWML